MLLLNYDELLSALERNYVYLKTTAHGVPKYLVATRNIDKIPEKSVARRDAAQIKRLEYLGPYEDYQVIGVYDVWRAEVTMIAFELTEPQQILATEGREYYNPLDDLAHAVVGMRNLTASSETISYGTRNPKIIEKILGVSNAAYESFLDSNKTSYFDLHSRTLATMGSVTASAYITGSLANLSKIPKVLVGSANLLKLSPTVTNLPTQADFDIYDEVTEEVLIDSEGNMYFIDDDAEEIGDPEVDLEAID